MNNEDIDLKGMKILIVDDTPANVEVLRQTLTPGGYELSIATTGEAAVKIASQFLPDLILMDILMPGLNGFETCQKLKEDELTRDIPIIFISAKSETNDIVEGFQNGGVDYITKPFQIREVRARVRTQLQLRAIMAQSLKSRKALKLYAAELERSNDALDEFASIASHDLKEPLRKIIMFGDRLEKTIEVEDSIAVKYLKRMQTSAERMGSFIDDLLRYSRVSTQARSFQMTDLNHALEEVLDSLEVRILESKGQVNIERLPKLDADPFLMHQLFQNLVGNALKFHKENESPVVNLKSRSLDDGMWEIHVEDNGIGFDEKFAGRIFKPFERLHGRSDYEGTGIGLAICGKIVKHHGGHVAVKSRPNQGSNFIITLPEKQIACA